jgi:hypothetical protein
VRTALAFFLILICYALLIASSALLCPLRLGEILQAAAFLNFSWPNLFAWIAQTPGGAPLHYLVQLPLRLFFPHSAIFLRLPSLVCALGSAVAFFALAKRVPIQQPLLALVLFLAIPTHLAYATQARPFELGLFLMLVASLSFFALVEKPGVFRAVIYAILLTACLYTQPSCFLPASGCLLGLLGFANLKTYRRALWYTLVATVLPLLAFAPYYKWAASQRAGDWWLVEQFPAYALKVTGLEALLSLDPGGWSPWFGLVLMSVLLLGLVGGVSSAMPLGSYPEGAPAPRVDIVRMRAVIFCLASGAIVTFLGETAYNGFYSMAFAPYQILWALPGMVIVFCAALDALLRLPVAKPFAIATPVLCILAALLCVPGDVEYMRTQPDDFAKLSALVRPQLDGDACVVFVSQRLSPYLFLVFEPALEKYECQNFFHKRIVLAIHPYVKPAQEREARIFFRGLDFEETHRDISGDGKIITMDAQR